MKNAFGSEYMRKTRYTDQFGRTKLFLKQEQVIVTGFGLWAEFMKDV
jgi:hypothetical protein